MPSVKSRYNGLIINIPSDARGVANRFYTQGGNELIFDQSKRGKVKVEPDTPVKIDSEAPDDAKKGNTHEADLA